MKDQTGTSVLAAAAIACCAGAPLLIGTVGASGALLLGLAVPALAISLLDASCRWPDGPKWRPRKCPGTLG